MLQNEHLRHTKQREHHSGQTLFYDPLIDHQGLGDSLDRQLKIVCSLCYRSRKYSVRIQNTKAPRFFESAPSAAKPGVCHSLSDHKSSAPDTREGIRRATSASACQRNDIWSSSSRGADRRAKPFSSPLASSGCMSLIDSRTTPRRGFVGHHTLPCRLRTRSSSPHD